MQCTKALNNELRYEKLEEEHRQLFDHYIRAYPLRNSEMTFNSIYIWKDNWPLWLSESRGRLFLKREYSFRTPCYWPVLCACKDIKDALCQLITDAEEQGWPFEMRGVDDIYKERMEKAFPGEFEFTYDRNFSDYAYRTEDMMALRGKKYHAKRNHVNRFMAEHPDYVFRRATMEDLDACRKVLAESITAAGQPERIEEELIVLGRTFEVAGKGFMDIAVLEVDGVIQGYTAGEVQQGDTALIHLEVANRDMQGAYPIINRDFLRDFFAETTWVNREEDVGMEGLRKAKLSYQPDHLLNKYIVHRKCEVRHDEDTAAEKSLEILLP